MNPSVKSILVGLCFVIGFLGPVMVASAEDLGAVRGRMSSRISQIDEMKERGVVGENNRGLLEERPGQGNADGSVIQSENRDRQVVYAELAKQTGTSAEQVARARARQIAQGSKSGVWIQDAGGNWSKK